MDPLLFEIRVTNDNHARIIHLSGEIDFSATLDIDHRLFEIIGKCKGPLLFDLNQVTFLDSEGLKMLIAAFNLAQSKRLTARIIRCSPQALRVITLAGVEDILLMSNCNAKNFPTKSDKPRIAIIQ